MTEININQVRNGYIVTTKDDELLYKLVFQEKESELYDPNEPNIDKEKVEAFRDLIGFLENQFGLDCVNRGDYYLDYEIKQKPIE